ncbi:MAG: helix-turn-helix transcriptional regulator [Bacteroides sp.]|nr:helix-turn-helix transcriptional regulator [Bacteroides sp.]
MIDPMTGYTPATSMKHLVRDNSALLPVISRFAIPFGFGDETIAKVCTEAGVDTDTFLTVCNLLSNYPYRNEKLSLTSLMDYLRRAHTSMLSLSLPRIRHHLIEAINSADTNGIVLMLIKFFDDYVAEVKRHLEHENDVVFRYVDDLLAGHRGKDFSISDFSIDHEPMSEKLRELKDIIIYHYRQTDDGRLSATLVDIINCEHDLTSHFDVENKLFAPAALALEQTVPITDTDDNHPNENNADGNSDTESQISLSSREREIIRCVALGLSNKEIAENLCISQHTVATHRRNIASKLDIHSSAALTIFAILHGLISVDEAKG